MALILGTLYISIFITSHYSKTFYTYIISKDVGIFITINIRRVDSSFFPGRDVISADISFAPNVVLRW